MKKFLTVLLALSVVFTYSFSAVGTAFAADAVEGSTPAELSYEQKLTEATKQLANNLENAKSDTVKKLANEYTENLTTGTVTIPKSVYETIANQVYGDYAKVLEIAAYQLKVAYGAADEAGKAALDAKNIADIKDDLAATEVLEANSKDYKDMKVGDADTTDEFTALVTSSNGQTAYLLDTLKLVFPIEQARVLAELDKIDLTLYTDDIMNPTAAFPVSYAKAAKAAKDALVSSAKKITLDAEGLTAEKVKEKIATLQELIAEKNIKEVDSYIGLDGKKIILTYKLADSNLKTKDDLKNENASLEAAKLAAKAEAQAKASAFYKDALAAYNDKTDTKAQFDEKVAEKDAYLEVELFKIDLATAAPITVTSLAAGTANRDLVAEYNALEQAAAAYKLQVEKDGSLKYIAAKIDENLAAAKAKIYGRTSETVKDTDLIVGAENKTEDIAWIKAKAVAAVEAERDEKLAKNTYYDKEAEEIKARYALKLAKINACTNEEQVKEVKNEAVDISDVKDAATVKLVIKGLAGYAKELEKVQAHMDQVVNADVNKWSDGYREFTTDDLANFYGEKGARTTAEIQALLADAKAMAAALPSVKEKKDAKAAAEKAVNDIPNRIALTDKAAVEAANKLVETAKEMGQTVSNESRLTTAIDKVKDLEIEALNDQIAALPALNKVTTADKAAVKAVADALDALYGTDMYGDLSKDGTVTAIDATVENYQKAVRAAVKADVEAKIAALTANASSADVEAARAAYDAFVEEYTDASEPYDAKAQIVNADKLFYAEAQVKANKIKAVESFKIKVTTKRYTGSKMRINWTATGDESAIDGYRIYYSTKKSNSGYKYLAKTTKKYINHTSIKKSVKKGTRVYYRVRAYVEIDGVRYFSDYSTVGNRIWK